MVREHHQLNGHELEQTPGDSGGQGSLVCCSPWGWKESDMAQRLNDDKITITFSLFYLENERNLILKQSTKLISQLDRIAFPYQHQLHRFQNQKTKSIHTKKKFLGIVFKKKVQNLCKQKYKYKNSINSEQKDILFPNGKSYHQIISFLTINTEIFIK